MIVIDDIKKRTLSWYDGEEYDELIQVLIEETEAEVNEMINWRHVPKEYTFNERVPVYNSREIYTSKMPINRISRVMINEEEVTEYCVEKATGKITLNSCLCIPCNECELYADVEYVVGGITEEYPLVIKSIIIDIVIKALNLAINNGHGYASKTILQDIKMVYNFEYTERQRMIMQQYL